MNIKNTKTQYGLVARILHWTSVALLLTILVVASQFEDMLASPEKLRLITLHVSVGLVFFILMLARLTWRNINHNPIKSYSIKNWQKIIAISLHRTIYIIIIAQCILGILVLITGGEDINFYGLRETFPVVHKNDLLNNLALNMHYFLSILIYPMFAIHITAAINHQVFGLIDDQ